MSDKHGWRETAALVWRPLVLAAATGAADPYPAARPWPAGLGWTRRIMIGRLPFNAVAQAADLLLVLIMLPGTYSLLLTEVRPAHPGYPGSLLFLGALAMTAPLALRHRHPLGAFRLLLVGMAWTSFQHWLSTPYVPAGTISGLLILYTVAVRCPRETTVGAGLLAVAGVWAADRHSAAGATVLILLPLVVGYMSRLRQASRRELAEQARRHREEAAVLTERQRIARELHDVVAHHMSMIAIQAEAAPYKAEVPAETRRDLAEIRATALDALTEMRRILGVLRSAEGAETAPQPGLDRLAELVTAARGTGLTVEDRLAGNLAALPSGVGLSAYRIVQEAMSNAMRHAPGSRVGLDVAHADGILRLTVVNGPPGPGHRPTPSPPGAGHGLAGMRERAAMLGGELLAGPTPEGGFQVSATLPVRDPA
ncbi:sensor histidine kinase [Actinomadura macrotermitis]|uniref:histidine kinase n=1 Tax=Actinomadura macrotermitis TaxID=2585200 RepID=A0A7K0C561_9ACTN|nr:sensor histidine kinase [Actinomadura macrotermitis]MQY08262.1 hypothetical protein [Actinomadura macrotermitis]